MTKQFMIENFGSDRILKIKFGDHIEVGIFDKKEIDKKIDDLKKIGFVQVKKFTKNAR
mgnify:CR=1 FL=1